jgi:hypothetical protein
MADIKELYGLLQQADSAAQSGNTQAIADVQALLGEIDRLNAQQPQVGAIEQPGALATPLQGGGLPQRAPTAPESDRVGLDSPQITPEFASDFRIITGMNPYALGKTPREALTGAVAKGALDPSFQAGQDFGAFGSQWEPYKQEQQSTMLGAAARGAQSQIGATIGGFAGATVGSAFGPIGTIAGGAAGGLLGNLAQESLQAVMGLKTEQDIAQDRLDQERDATKYARFAGEFLPQVGGAAVEMAAAKYAPLALKFLPVTERFATEQIGKAVAKDIPAITSLATGAALGGGIAGALDYFQSDTIDPGKIAIASLTGAILEPRKQFQTLFDKAARLEIAALKARNNTIQQMAGDTTSAIDRLAEYRMIPENRVNLGAGSISGDEGLIALEQHVFNRDPQMRNQRQEALRQISENISGAVEQRGASAWQAKQFLENDFAQMDLLAKQAYQSAIDAGKTAEAAILGDAVRATEEANRIVNQGLMSRQTAHSLTKRNLSEAAAQIRAMQGERALPSQVVLETLQNNAAAEKSAVNDLLVQIPADVQTNFSNTKKAAAEARKLVVREEKFAPKVEAFLSRIAGTKKKPYVDSIQELPKVSSMLADEISKAQRAGDTQQVKMLRELRSGIEADLEAASSSFDYPQLKAWREAYRQYAGKYLNNSSETALVIGSVDPNKVIDHYMKKSGQVKGLAGAEQLKEALGDSPAAKLAVSDWFMGQLAKVGGSTPENSIGAMNKWFNSADIQELLSVFPDAKPKIKSLIAGVELNLENQVAAEKSKKAAEAFASKYKSPLADRLKTEAAQAMADAERQAKMALAVQEKALQEHVAQKFINMQPVDAIASIIGTESTDPVVATQLLLDAAAKDPTGNALQGVKNALFEYIDKQVRSKAVVSTSNVPGAFKPKDFESTVAKMADVLAEGTNSRKVIEQILGSYSVEMRNLDIASKQLEILARRKRATAGMSQTTPQKVIESTIEEQFANNTMNFLGRMARGYNKQNVVSGSLAWAGDLVQRAWVGDVQKRAYQAITDAIKDPELLQTVLMEATPQNLPAIRGWLKTYGVPYAFDMNKVEQETLGQGGVVTDKESGFRIVTKEGKKFKIFSPSGQLLGVYDTQEKAEKAADREILKARKLK